MDVRKLKAKVIERGMNVETLAAKLGVDRSTMYRKLGEIEKFTVGEARKIKEELGLTGEEARDIFFGDTVA